VGETAIEDEDEDDENTESGHKIEREKAQKWWEKCESKFHSTNTLRVEEMEPGIICFRAFWNLRLAAPVYNRGHQIDNQQTLSQTHPNFYPLVIKLTLHFYKQG